MAGTGAAVAAFAIAPMSAVFLCWFVFGYFRVKTNRERARRRYEYGTQDGYMPRLSKTTYIPTARLSAAASNGAPPTSADRTVPSSFPFQRRRLGPPSPSAILTRRRHVELELSAEADRVLLGGRLHHQMGELQTAETGRSSGGAGFPSRGGTDDGDEKDKDTAYEASSDASGAAASSASIALARVQATLNEMGARYAGLLHVAEASAAAEEEEATHRRRERTGGGREERGGRRDGAGSETEGDVPSRI